ncbi:MAG: aminofutalosine synthase MqnE [Helicobacteraceae bacterium]|jgi:aminodeoxyfutalosine synthase|nr:aminofutalosine synthase MqnE [Helicobacteraceae bacterium]
MQLNEALKLYDLELFELGARANEIRRKYHGDKVFYNRNRHINPTNICSDRCLFCGFSAHRKNPHPYTMSIDEIAQTAVKAQARGAKEVHVVGAHNKKLGLDWYFEMFKAIKKAAIGIHLKAMTAAEVDFLSRTYAIDFDEILDRMIASGVDSMPGGGAEIFDEKLRAQICDGKVKSANWLLIHELWHGRGRKSNASMLFGHIETRAHRVDHLLRLRALQKKTGGFNAFIPLLYQTKNNFLDVKKPLDSEEILKTIAISRIILDNVPHIKAYWVGLTLNLALVAQEFGADDMDGTIERESINSAAGADSKDGVNEKLMRDLITSAGFTPIERDSMYKEIG